MAPSSSAMLCPATQRPEEVPPPTSAGSGGWSATAELGAAVCGAALLALADGEARPGVDGVAVVGDDADVVGVEVAFPEALAAAGAPWKSTQDSVRTELPPTVTLSAVAVIV